MKKEINLDSWFDLNLHNENRTIYFGPWNNAAELGGNWARDPWEVDDWSAQSLIKGLYTLEYEKVAPITILWLSYGGDWDAGMAIYDYITNLKSPVTLKAYGRMRSMGTILLQACEKRLLSKNCLFLIHYGHAWCEGHQKEVVAFTEELEKNNATMEKIYLKKIREKHPDYTLKKLQKMMKYDKYMTAKEAVKLGLADKVI